MKEKVEDKRTAILEATLSLIAENGFHGTSMSMIAKNAGVSTGIAYHYFESKDELITEIYKMVKLRLNQAMMADFDENDPLAVQIRKLSENSFKYHFRNHKEAMFLGQYVVSPYYRSEVIDELRQTVEPVFESFERARREGIIKDFPMAVISTLTIDVASSLAQKEAAGIVELTDEDVDRVMNIVLDALMT